jgi:hypothetical protein
MVLQHFMTLSLASGNNAVMLLVAVISIFTVFYHENFSVLLSKGLKVKIDMLY